MNKIENALEMYDMDFALEPGITTVICYDCKRESCGKYIYALRYQGLGSIPKCPNTGSLNSYYVAREPYGEPPYWALYVGCEIHGTTSKPVQGQVNKWVLWRTFKNHIWEVKRFFWRIQYTIYNAYTNLLNYLYL